MEDEGFDCAGWSGGEFEGEFNLVAVLGGELVEDYEGVDLPVFGCVGVEVATMSLIYPWSDLCEVDLSTFAVLHPIRDPSVYLFDKVLRDGDVRREIDFLDAFGFCVADFAGEVFIATCGVVAGIRTFFCCAG